MRPDRLACRKGERSKKTLGAAQSRALPLTDVKTAEFHAKPIESVQSRVERAVQARRGVKGKKAQKGHCIGYTQTPASGEIHVVGSVVAQLVAGESLQEGLREEHMRYRKIAGRGRRNIVFLVDTSGSMVGSGRLSLVKGCVVSLLSDAYVTRTRVAIIGFGGLRAHLILPFTSSAELAAQRIDAVKGGGSTPLFDAFRLAVRIIDDMQDESAEVVLLSDGGYDRSRIMQPSKVIRSFGEYCKKKGVPIYFVDSGSGKRTAEQRARRLARALHADYRKLDDMRVDEFVEYIGTGGVAAPITSFKTEGEG